MEKANHIIYTNKVACSSCHKCVKVCPVSAISISGGQTHIVQELCVNCGMCINICPHNARKYRRDWISASEELSNNKKLILTFSVDEVFSIYYEKELINKIPTALRKLGAKYVGEACIGAEISGKKILELYKSENKKKCICSSCFSTINYIEKYKSENVDMLLPVHSPVMSHAIEIRKQFKNNPNVRVIYVGPCIARKAEAERYDEINYSITFEELNEWLDAANINLKELGDSNFDQYPSRPARFQSLSGGGLYSAGVKTNVFHPDILSVTGADDIKAVIDFSLTNKENLWIESFMCRNGCCNGPVSNNEKNRFAKRLEFKNYSFYAPVNEDNNFSYADDVKVIINPTPVKKAEYTDLKLQKTLDELGKIDTNSYLNCGACGYRTCREAADAILNNMADLDICVHRNKQRSQNLSGIVLQNSPNAIVTLDENLNIVNINQAFKKMFKCGDLIINKPLSQILDVEAYEKALVADEPIYRVINLDRFGLICRSIILKIPNENYLIGIYIDITDLQQDREQLLNLKNTTAIKAKELLEHQMKMMETIVEYIGDSSAKSEELVENMLSIISNSEKIN